MQVRTLVITTALLSGLSLTGCGPTKYGKQMRTEANERLALVGSKIEYDQARRAYETGQFDNALGQINMAIARSPKIASYHVLKGRIHLETHRLELALESFQNAIELDEEEATAHYFAGIVFERWSDDQKALDAYSVAFEKDDTNAQFLLAKAETLIALGRYDDAKTAVEDRLTYFEYNAGLRHLLGQIESLNGDPAAAVRHYREARVLKPDDVALLEELALAQFDAEQYAQCYESVTDLKRLFETPRYDLVNLEARCLTLLGRSTEARDLYIEMTRQRPDDADSWVSLGLLSRELNDFRRVATCSVRIIGLAPDRYEGYMLKGINERHHGNLGESERQLEEATRRAPAEALPHLLYAQCLEEQGKTDSALAAYTYADEIDPGNEYARSRIDLLLQDRVTIGQDR